MSNQNDDSELFKKAMKDVKPLNKKSNRIASIPLTKKMNHKLLKPKQAESYTIQSHISDHENETVSWETFLSFCRSGIQPRYFRKLESGNIPIEATLDLHKKTIDVARTELLTFIETASKAGIRYVRIIHGKGYHSEAKKPLIKNKVNAWLKQLPQILAFCSCQPKHGGTGAVNVLLRKIDT